MTTEAAGIVRSLSIEPGQPVKAGTVLVQLNTATNWPCCARSRPRRSWPWCSATAGANWARTSWSRRPRSKSVRPTAATTLAQVEAQRALIAQKTIRAPFDGILGLRKVNLGQYVNPGDPIVTLQSMDPIFLDFSLPEQRVGQVLEGTRIRATVDALPGQVFEGKVTAIEPLVDASTRNFKVQATLPNPDNNLRPGTFAHVGFDTGGARKVVVIPQTAVSFNPYGNAVYVISEVPSAARTKRTCRASRSPATSCMVKQRFIKTGATRGDLVVVTEGLKPGERIASSGLLKLRNDAEVTINNKVQPIGQRQPDAREPLRTTG